MGISVSRRRSLAACLLSVLCLGACATGQGSFVAGSGSSSDNGETFAEDDGFYSDAAFDRDAPGLLTASGNVLLAGGRNLAPPTLGAGAGSSAPPLLSTGPVRADLDVNAGLLNGANASAGLATGLGTANVNVGLLNGTNASAGLATGLGSANLNAALGGPLLALNGSQASLLGVSAVGPTVLGVTPNLSAGLNTAINPATAATQSVINATVGATTPSGPITAPVGGAPLMPPVLGVPGTTPLRALLPLLPTAPKPPVLPGLLGN